METARYHTTRPKCFDSQGLYPATPLYSLMADEEEYDPNSLEATRPLDIRDGRIHFNIYGQDGHFVALDIADNQYTRMFVVWLRKYDRN